MSNILIVDDDPSQLKLLSHILKKAGYFVMAAANAKEALEGEMEAVPDLLIVDKEMPGMDGFELVDKIKAEYATSFIRVIILSSRDEIEIIRDGLEAGADDYITKQDDKKLLLARVQAQLRTKTQIDHLRREIESLKDRIAKPTQQLQTVTISGNEKVDVPVEKKTGPKKWPQKLSLISDKGIHNVLMVCRMNLVRSPLAELLLKYQIKKHGLAGIQVQSAGLDTTAGDRLRSSVVQAFSSMNINLSQHQAKPLSYDLVELADIILPMEKKHVEKIVERYPSSCNFVRPKVFLLGSFGSDDFDEKEIADPVKKSIFDYRLCYHDVFQSINGFVDFLQTINLK
jgi:CheY-like chemotaxis protein/protein-tyrosine-phosphatase